MPKREEMTVWLIEHDGDRSSDLGGFNIEVHAGGQLLTRKGPGYDSARRRAIVLRAMRSKTIKVAEALGLKIRELLLK